MYNDLFNTVTLCYSCCLQLHLIENKGVVGMFVHFSEVAYPVSDGIQRNFEYNLVSKIHGLRFLSKMVVALAHLQSHLFCKRETVKLVYSYKFEKHSD